jgi:hypothetical protein
MWWSTVEPTALCLADQRVCPDGPVTSAASIHNDTSPHAGQTLSTVSPGEDVFNSNFPSITLGEESSDFLSTRPLLLDLVESSTTVQICSIR